MPFSKENILYGIISILVIGLLISIYLYFRTSKNLKTSKQTCNPSTATCPTTTCPTCHLTADIVLYDKVLFMYYTTTNPYLQLNVDKNVLSLDKNSATKIDLKLLSGIDLKFALGFQLQINGKYITIQPTPGGNVITPGQNKISLTDKFFYNDISNLISGATPTASLFIMQDADNGANYYLYASFQPQYLYKAYRDDTRDPYVAFDNNESQPYVSFQFENF
jgi:hypothetical protein